MSELSPNFALPYMQSSQAQKHVTHNEALERLDVLAQLALEGFATLTPPAAPTEGEAHGIGAGATGVWAGQDGRIAAWLGGTWVFIDPGHGWRAWGRAEAELRAWDGAAWTPVTGDMTNLDGVGIGAAWDSVNRLAVASDAALFTHAGGGHQLKINKASSGDTGSILYQTNWSGRAEMGLAASDDFAVKVSDGTDWFEALRIDHTTGAVSLPNTVLPARQIYPITGRWYMEPGNGWAGFSTNWGSATENYTQIYGTGAEPDPLWYVFGPFLESGAVLHSVNGMLRVNNTEVTAINIRVILGTGPFDTGDWGAIGDVTYTTIASVNGLALEDNHFNAINIDLGDHVVSADSVMLMFIQPVGTVTATRFLNGPLSFIFTAAP